MDQPINLGKPRLLVGLGNPGNRYDGTRHNIGFEVIDTIADKFNGTWKSWRSNSQISEVVIGELSVRLIKPLTYMNRSGEPLQEFAQYFGIEPSEMVVIHDELDLPAGELRLKFGGGEAGHNGLRSISQMLGTKEYWRLRCGIGKPINKDEVTNWVLQSFSKEEKESKEALITLSISAVTSMCKSGIKSAQHVLHDNKRPPS